MIYLSIYKNGEFQFVILNTSSIDMVFSEMDEEFNKVMVKILTSKGNVLITNTTMDKLVKLLDATKIGSLKNE